MRSKLQLTVHHHPRTRLLRGPDARAAGPYQRSGALTVEPARTLDRQPVDYGTATKQPANG